MTLESILSQIFSAQLFWVLYNNYCEIQFDNAKQIFENEILTWLASLESMYSSTIRKIMFIKPDYNETLFYEIKYKYDSNSINIDEVCHQLKPSFELENELLECVVLILTTLLNHKGDLKSIGINEENLIQAQQKGKLHYYLNSYMFHIIEKITENEGIEQENIGELQQMQKYEPFKNQANKIINDAQILIDQVKILWNKNDKINNNLMINKTSNDSNKYGSQYTDEWLVFEFPCRTKVDKELTDVEEEEDEGDDNNPWADQIADIIK